MEKRVSVRFFSVWRDVKNVKRRFLCWQGRQKAARAGTLRVGPCFLRVVWSADGLFDFSVEHSFTEFLSNASSR